MDVFSTMPCCQVINFTKKEQDVNLAFDVFVTKTDLKLLSKHKLIDIWHIRYYILLENCQILI